MSNKNIVIVVAVVLVLCVCCIFASVIGWFVYTNYYSIATPINSPTFSPVFPTSSSATGSCVVGGCNGTVCMAASQLNNYLATNCSWDAIDSCYSYALCERQSDGYCGWTFTKSYDSCVTNLY